MSLMLSQFSSVAWLCPTLCDPMNCSMAGLPVHLQLPEFTQTHAHWVSDVIQPSYPCHPLLLLPYFSQDQDLSNESFLLIRWPKYWRFSFSISPFNEYSGLISFRIDWFDLLAVQGTLKSLQYHSLEASIPWCSAFFMILLSHPYMTTWKTIALTIWTFVSKVIPLLFSILSRFIIAFISRSSIFNFMAAVTVCSDFGAQENKVCHCFHCFPIYLSWSDGAGGHDLSFLNAEF